jgi:hypothetical protein
MNLHELQSCLERLGIKLSFKLVVDAPVGALTPRLRTALATHKAALLVGLAGMGFLKAPEAPGPLEPASSRDQAPDVTRATSAIATDRPALHASLAGEEVTDSVDDYGRIERAAIMEFDGGLTRAAAERAAGLLTEKDA